MKVTISDCLKLDALKSGAIAAGRDYEKNNVRSVSVMDGRTLEGILAENSVKYELVLMSKDTFLDNMAFMGQIVSGFSKDGVAGICIFGKFGENPEKELKDIIEDCDKAGIPLLYVASEDSNPVRYGQVIEEIMDRVLYGDNFRNDLINNTIYHLLNFERHVTFENALKEAAVNNDFQVILLSKNYNRVMAVETRHRATIEDAIRLGKERDVENSVMYTFIDVNGVRTYWGPLNINGEKYFIFIVDNDDNYSAGEITKLAEIIELAMGMWKYTPERDAKAELIKALNRGNRSLAYSLRNELDISDDDIISVFYARGLEESHGNNLINALETRYPMEVLRITEDHETYGIILRTKDGKLSEYGEESAKNLALNLFSDMKEGSKAVRIFHATGFEGLEGALSGFRLMNETWTFVESVFPYKRVFTKYELTMVTNCINIRLQNSHLKKTYMDLLAPFKKELGENKAKQLLETLETFVLDAGMNSAKTAVFMGVHTNTVQYRLKRINEVLGADLTGNRVIPGLTVALALRRLENAEN